MSNDTRNNISPYCTAVINEKPNDLISEEVMGSEGSPLRASACGTPHEGSAEGGLGFFFYFLLALSVSQSRGDLGGGQTATPAVRVDRFHVFFPGAPKIQSLPLQEGTRLRRPSGAFGKSSLETQSWTAALMRPYPHFTPLIFTKAARLDGIYMNLAHVSLLHGGNIKPQLPVFSFLCLVVVVVCLFFIYLLKS